MDIYLRVNVIAEYLEKGESTATILKEFTGRWKVTRGTIVTYLATAREIVAERNKIKQAAIETSHRQAINKVANEQILSDTELEALLCSIARGELILEKIVTQNGIEKIIKYRPTHFDMVQAIDKLWKRRSGGVKKARN